MLRKGLTVLGEGGHNEDDIRHKRGCTCVGRASRRQATCFPGGESPLATSPVKRKPQHADLHVELPAQAYQMHTRCHRGLSVV